MKNWLLTSLLSLGLVSATLPVMAKDLPFPLFDSHTHFYTDDFSSYPLHPEHAYMGVKGLIDIVLEHPNTPANIFQLWQQNGVAGGVAVQYSAAYQTDDRYVLAVARQYPRQISPVVMLDTNAADAPQQLRTLVEQQGVAGLRVTGPRAADGQFLWLDSAPMRKIWEVANALHLPVIVFPSIHNPQSHAIAIEVMRKVIQLAQRYPDTRIVLDHCGWMAPSGAPDYGFSGIYLELTRQKNIYFKVTSINFRNLQAQHISTSAFLRHAVDLAGADHILWGSDLGNTRIPYAQMVSAAISATAELNDAERKEVLHDTGYRLFTRAATHAGARQ